MRVPAFWAGLRGDQAGSFRLMNAETGHVVAQIVEPAITRAARNQGLLGRDRLDPSTALLIAPCFAVHTFRMRFAIDVIFVAKDGRVVRIVTDLGRSRMAGSLRAAAVVELAAGTLKSLAISVGDRLYLAPGGDSLAIVAPRCEPVSSQNSTTRGWRSRVAWTIPR